MATVSEALAIAVRYHRAGRLAEAQQIYRQILAVEPEQAEALHLLGVIAHQGGQHAAAVQYISRAIGVKGTDAGFHNNLAQAYFVLERTAEAVACYRRALELWPDFAEAHYNLGNALKSQELRGEAAACFRRALEIKPDYVEALNNLGNVLKDQGELAEAAACYRRALALRPDFVEAHNNLGNALQSQGDADQAVACYRRALQLNPHHVRALNNLGNALQGRAMLDEAIACYRRALELKPDYAEAQCNLGNAHKDQGDLVEAIACYRRAVEIQPDFAGAHSNLVYAQVFCAGYDAPAIYREHILWNRQHAASLAKFIQPHRNDRRPERRLRVGYVSPHFRGHAESFFTAPLLAAHDHANFEIFCYCDAACPDDVTARLRGCADVWRNVVGLRDAEVASLVRQDGIDILVDLTMHMAGSRLLVFARKPAPVQVCWLAYQGTTGLSTVDYRLTDPYVDPPGLFDQYYTEKSVRFADCFGCYDPLGSELPVQGPPAATQGYVTFGCLNNFCKINDAVVRLWAATLKAVDRSCLLLLAPEGTARRRLSAAFAREGIAPERITYVAQQPRGAYLETYHAIDVALDTLPYNGQTTSLDALWMGAAVVTLAGQTAVGRAGLSLLTNLGLPELVARTPRQFVQIAAAWAGDIPRLAELRATLRQRMQRSPLMDAPRFARQIEAAYRQMWQRWCAGECGGNAEC